LPKDLTPRELEICGLLTKGYSNADLAKELFLAEGTVKNYMMNIYDKFDIHDRTALVLFLKDIIA
jgi:DNA-binding NarL/FixJ family response regulator